MFTLIASIIQKGGVLGVFFLMLVENLLPFIPSELIMPLAGFEAARGAMGLWWALAGGAAGSVLGGWAWYEIGRKLGLARVMRWADAGGRWVAVSSAELKRGDLWFRRWGAAAVFIGRTLPGVRGVICLPAGVAKMPRGAFLFWSTMGAGLWTVVLVFAGYQLKTHYSDVVGWVDPVTDGFVVLCLIVYGVRVVRYAAPPPP
jgi:membrane protein DedA with SNARE-associated domain